MFAAENLPGFLPIVFWGIVTISLLVFIHEAGHFIAARVLGLRVTEFFIGLPGPRISFKRGDTTYGITAIPLGGWVRVPALEGSGPGAELGTMTEEERAEYNNVPAWKRVTVLLSGVIANLLFAIIILTALFTYTGVPVDYVTPSPGGPAAVAGMPDNVEITAIDGRRVHGFHMLSDIIAGKQPGDVVTVIYATPDNQRNTIEVTLEPRTPPEEPVLDLEGNPITPEQLEELLENLPPAQMGIMHTSVSYERAGVFAAFGQSLLYIQLTAEGISRLFSPATFVDAISDASSVIGISIFAAHTASAGFIAFVNFVALISIALGLMNLLPIPPLDGGKILFEIIQKITRKPVSENLQVGVSLTGFALLIVLMVYLMGQDLFRIFW